VKTRTSAKKGDNPRAPQVSGFSERVTWLRKGGAHCRVSRGQIHEAVEGSLTRLGIDTIDLLQIHWPDRYVPLFGRAGYDPKERRDAVPFEEQLAALQELVEQGKVRDVRGLFLCGCPCSEAVLFCRSHELRKHACASSSSALLEGSLMLTGARRRCHSCR
jgi:Aldo/keto reductase family